jgi:hypothetical protein
MASSSIKSKSATETLLDKFSKMAAEESKHMSEQEFKRAVKESREIINRVRASRARKRETA